MEHTEQDDDDDNEERRGMEKGHTRTTASFFAAMFVGQHFN